ncbi:hypothetical protein Salat_2751400 [Sesamum alatum]|uniref:Uncharacterized protein n=1 Tax=Sesamum alatum TaxID=300844 RepID=A0AAE2C8Y4_9LAMI|nr:hypothetical protein Salat_2751400 [Sesamum alatum]
MIDFLFLGSAVTVGFGDFFINFRSGVGDSRPEAKVIGTGISWAVLDSRAGTVGAPPAVSNGISREGLGRSEGGEGLSTRSVDLSPIGGGLLSDGFVRGTWDMFGGLGGFGIGGPIAGGVV